MENLKFAEQKQNIRNLSKILIALMAKNAGKVTNAKLRFYIIKKSEDYIQTTCIFSDHDQKFSEVSKETL